MTDWVNFFVAEVGASAALAGLVVVAISINLSRILAFPQLPARAAESLVMLTAALLLASCGLIPGQPMPIFGAEVLLIGIVSVVVTAYNQLRPLPPIEGVGRLRRLLRAALSAAATLPVIIGGVLVIRGSRVAFIGWPPACWCHLPREFGTPGFC